MYQVIIVFHVLLGLGVIGLVLMQQGKGADAGAAFGTGASGSVFGAQGAASFLSRTTAILAALFFTTSLTLAVLNSHKGVVYDLMSEPTPVIDEHDTPLKAPGVSAEQATDSLPSVPAVPTASNAEQVQAPAAEIKQTEVPKAKEIKTVEQQTAVEKTKNPVKGK